MASCTFSLAVYLCCGRPVKLQERPRSGSGPVCSFVAPQHCLWLALNYSRFGQWCFLEARTDIKAGLYHIIGGQVLPWWLALCNHAVALRRFPECFLHWECFAECVPNIPGFCRCWVFVRELHHCVGGCSLLQQAMLGSTPKGVRVVA